MKVQVRRSLSSKIPSQLIDGDLKLGEISYDPEDQRLHSMVIYTDHLAFVVSRSKPFRHARPGFDKYIGHPQSSAHGRRGADGGDHSPDGPAQRRRGLPSAHVRGAGRRAGRAAVAKAFLELVKSS